MTGAPLEALDDDLLDVHDCDDDVPRAGCRCQVDLEDQAANETRRNTSTRTERVQTAAAFLRQQPICGAIRIKWRRK